MPKRQYTLTETGKKNRVSNFTDEGRKTAVENRKRTVDMRIQQRRDIVKRLHLEGLPPKEILQRINKMGRRTYSQRTIDRDLDALNASIKEN